MDKVILSSNRRQPECVFKDKSNLSNVLVFSESKFYVLYNDENHFQIRGLVAELHGLEYSVTKFCTFEKTCLKC